MALLLVVATAMTACGNNDAGTTPADTAVVETPPPADTDTADNDAADVPADDDVNDEVAAADIHIALVAHSPDSILDDGSFNEGAWQGITRFLNRHGLDLDTHRSFFIPHEASTEARLDFISQAIDHGANVLVLPGFHFEESLYIAQDMFPEVNFILLDASPRNAGVARVQPNVAAIHYAEEEAGFLAGYAAVMEGHRELGFMGGIAVPAVVRFGHGFIQGAEFAATALGLESGEVEINYLYLGGFAPSPDHVVTASGWFAGGTEVIFAAAGGAAGSVMTGAEASGGLVIGVDVDQSGDSDTVITSAMKALDVSVDDMLTDIMNGQFRGGIEHMFNAAINGVSLPMDTSRFQNFTQAQYDAIFAQLASGAINVNSSLTMSDIIENIELVTVNEM